MFPSVPRTLLVLLFAVVGLRLVFALLEPGVLALSLLKVGLLVLFAWQTLQGKESAAKVLAILLLLGAALDTFGLVHLALSGEARALVLLALPVFHIGVAMYIFRSKAVGQFLAKRAFASSYAP